MQTSKEKQMISKRGGGNKLACTSSLAVSVPEILGKEFFWVSGSGADDPISRSAKNRSQIFPEVLMPLIRKPGCFLDLGANIGGISLALAACGWTGYAAEASAFNCSLMEKSIILNGFDITLCKKGIWKNSGELYFVQNGPWGSINEQGVGEKIDVICLDDYRETVFRTIERLDFIKMDIEGSEVAALEGMGNFLREFDYPCIFAEANAFTLFITRKNTVGDMIRQARQYGYGVYRYQDGMWAEFDDTYFIEELCTDYMFIHKDKKNSFEGPIGGVYPRRTLWQDVQFTSGWLNRYIDNPEELEAFSSTIGICATLKEFHDLSDNPEIRALLKAIKDLPGKDMLMESALDWLEQ